MKLSQVAVFVFLLLVFTIPEETEAGLPLSWFARIAAALSVRLLKKAYYARCNVRYVPPGINCPSVAFGMGWSRNQAQKAARVYASTVGDAKCGAYVGHCQIAKFK